MPEMPGPPYRLLVSRPAARALAEKLPEGVAAAVAAFVTGDLLKEPRRVGKPLRRELEGRWSARRGNYRVIYAIDDEAGAVVVIDIDHRKDVHRRR